MPCQRLHSIHSSRATARTAIGKRRSKGSEVERVGGFILGPSHSIAKGTPYDNFMAVLDEYVRLRDKAW